MILMSLLFQITKNVKSLNQQMATTCVRKFMSYITEVAYVHFDLCDDIVSPKMGLTACAILSRK